MKAVQWNTKDRPAWFDEYIEVKVLCIIIIMQYQLISQ